MVPKEAFNDNLSLHYTKHGEGSPVVLVHGFAASNFDWAYLEPDLIENGYQVYSPDLIGHVNSIRSIYFMIALAYTKIQSLLDICILWAVVGLVRKPRE